MQNKPENKLKLQKDRRTVAFSNWLPLLLLWPFGAMVRAFANFRSPHAKTVVWSFFVFFGFVFVYGRDYYGVDSARYAQEFTELHNNWFSFDYLSSLFYSDDRYVDLYYPLISWFVAFFTGDPRWLFTALSAVFGYFYVQNLWMVFQKTDKNNKSDIVLILFMLAFALVNPIWNINGVRMWTAAQVFVYGVLQFLLEKNKRGWIWIFISVLFHFSFFVPVAIFFLYYFVPNNLTVLLIFFYASSLLRELDLSIVRNALSFLPDFLQPRVVSYTNEDYLERLTEARSAPAFHVWFSEIARRWLLYSWVLIIYIKRNKWLNRHASILSLYTFGLFMGGIAQILSNVPSGGRYMTIVSVVLYAVIVLFVSDRKMHFQLQVYKHLSFPFILFVIVFQIRIGFDYIGISTFISNPIIAAFVEDTEPLIVFVKGLL